MSTRLTRITEICTGLGMIGGLSLDDVFAAHAPPEILEGVDAPTWDALCGYWSDASDREVFRYAFDLGRYFLESADALRGRSPKLIEWRGPIRLPERDPLPADLRIDHVYVVSCKNLSKILRNPSPVALFRDGRTDGQGGGADWYQVIAPEEYEALYRGAVELLGLSSFPRSVSKLSRTEKEILKRSFERRWPPEIEPQAREFIAAVSERSAIALRSAIHGRAEQERFYWQLLRLHSSSYYILGRLGSGPSHIRVLTPWDFRRKFSFISLDISPASAGQPQVNWIAAIRDEVEGVDREVHGHIEIRWSHGRFNGAPEGKIYLDTPHRDAPGYEEF